MTSSNEIRSAISRMLRSIGRPDARFSLSRERGGRNNRLYRLVQDDGPPLCVKEYFQDPDDPRNRARTEYEFARFAWESAGVRCIPQPHTYDGDAGLGLYEYVEGRALHPSEVDAGAIEEALVFFAQLSRARESAGSLRSASEAQFDVKAHVAAVDARVSVLEQLRSTDRLDEMATEFTRTRLRPTFDAVATAIRVKIAERGVELSGVLPESARCVSPSDFGFHNALRSGQRTIFLDFEYGGWDDPAKLVGDFFSQVAYPVPMAHYDQFARSVLRVLDLPGHHLDRIAVLLPVYRMKWICIVLNDFSPTGRRRRSFALGSPGEVSDERRHESLVQAESLLREFVETGILTHMIGTLE